MIVAGGSGTRMQSEVPKQFVPINGKPILMHTLERFYRYSPAIQIFVVLPASETDYWQHLCEKHGFNVPHQVVSGGANRTESVRNGLNAIEGDNGIVAIHDGVRPLISVELISASFKTAKDKGNAIAAVRLKDSIRRVTPLSDSRSGYSLSGSFQSEHSQAEDRSQFRIIQTPQTFRLEIIKKAYKLTPTQEVLSDDASIIEKHGWKVYLIEGDYHNIKITTPEDLSIAEAFLSKASAMR